MSSLLWLPGAVAMPGLLLLLTFARTGNAATPRQRVDAFGLGMLLAPLLAPFAIVAPFASAMPPAGATLASGWLESGLLEELAKAWRCGWYWRRACRWKQCWLVPRPRS
ncbi:hypothetical protein [Geminicoccus flavidas]|uniref:hypothetical protein n=1 Tax=Geminicoccus flavidas TaxID=2506407 RepID=UPI00135C5BD1|nr:hypothetical protein [Geminicoccus flavidas]